MSCVVFDIETGPRPVEEIQALLGPFDPASRIGPRPGSFDASTVKVGNLKDEAKIAEKIEAARKQHEALADNYDRDLEQCESSYWSEVVSRAELSATTGEIVAIGYRTEKKSLIHHADELSEKQQLEYFWNQFQKIRQQGRRLVGFNSNGFDLPFIARRSWMLKVEVPAQALTPTGWLDPTFVDLLGRWQFGNKRDYVKLDEACRSLGLDGKPDGIDGSMFHELYRSGDAEKRATAIAYLENDLLMTWQLGERLGVIC